MKISIAMATYNGSRYLHEQLESFTVQSRLPDELVICDDGSSDDTLEILERFAATAPFGVHVVKNQVNLGYTQNFAKAMSLCAGDIIFLSDQDDVWFDNKIERVVSRFETCPECWIVVHDGRIVDEQRAWAGTTKLQQIRAGYGLKELPVTGALTALRHEMLQYALPIPPGIVGHDAWLHNLCRIFENRRVLLAECLQSIRRHAANTSEWVVNSQKPIGKLDVFFSQLKTAPAEDYSDRIIFNQAMQGRLVQLAGILNTTIEITAAMAERNRLMVERTALERRQRLAIAGPLVRRYLAMSMLLFGDYRHFNRLRSFFRDMMR